MRILANLLIVAGVLGLLLTNAAIYWLANFGCGMNTTGCRSDPTTVFWRFLGKEEALSYYWLPCILSVGVFLLGLGLRRVDKPAPAP